MGSVSDKFGAISRKIQSDVKDELKAQAQRMKGTIAGFTPVRTGNLRKSIKIQSENDKEIVYTDVEYAGEVEYGKNNTKPAAMFRKSIIGFNARAKNAIKSRVKSNL